MKRPPRLLKNTQSQRWQKRKNNKAYNEMFPPTPKNKPKPVVNDSPEPQNSDSDEDSMNDMGMPMEDSPEKSKSPELRKK
eukprot:UN32585